MSSFFVFCLAGDQNAVSKIGLTHGEVSQYNSLTYWLIMKTYGRFVTVVERSTFLMLSFCISDSIK